MPTKEEILALLREQLDGLSTAVAGDEKFVQNQADYIVTLASLKKRIEEAHKMPDVLMGGTQTGRTSSKNPNISTLPRTHLDDIAIKAAEKAAEEQRLNPPKPTPNRRAAIEHTRKLNESGNDS